MTRREPADLRAERARRLWDSPIVRCGGCGGWRFAEGWCDYCNPDRDPWS